MKNTHSLVLSVSTIKDIDKLKENTKYINIDITNCTHEVIEYFLKHGENYLYSETIENNKGYIYVVYDNFYRAETIINAIYASMPNDLNDLEIARYLYTSIAKYVFFDINIIPEKNESYSFSLINQIGNIWGSLSLGRVTKSSISKIYYYLCKRLNIDNSIEIDNDKELYKVFFVLIYEELSSNDPQISFKIKEAIFTLIDLLQAAFNDESEMILEETINEEIPQNIYEEENHWDIPEEKETQKTLIEEKNIIINDFEEKISNSFIIHNKKYLEEFIRRKNLIPYQCNICGLSEWQNEPLQLELDSLDGIYNNLNLNNLRFLCPNCYSQVGHFN